MEKGPAVTKRRISKPGGFTIPGTGKRETRIVNEGDEVTKEMREHWEEWQKLANSGGNININDYTS